MWSDNFMSSAEVKTGTEQASPADHSKQERILNELKLSLAYVSLLDITYLRLSYPWRTWVY